MLPGIDVLRNRLFFSLNTSLGLTTKSLDPDLGNILISEDSLDSLQGTKPDDGKPLIQDKTIVFSMDIKF